MANYRDLIPALIAAGFNNTHVSSIAAKHVFKATDEDDEAIITRLYNELVACDFEFDVTLAGETYLLGSDVAVRFDDLSFYIEKPVDFQRKVIRQ